VSALFNQYSYVMFSVGAILIIVGVIRLAYHVRWTVLVSAGVLMGLVAATGLFLLRPGAGDVDSTRGADIILNDGKPTFLEFFSNFCAGCLAARPAVNQLVKDIHDEYADGFNVLRIDIHTDVGRALRQRYGFTYSPEFVLFDSQTQEVWRGHVPPDLSQVSLAGGNTQ